MVFRRILRVGALRLREFAMNSDHSNEIPEDGLSGFFYYFFVTLFAGLVMCIMPLLFAFLVARLFDLDAFFWDGVIAWAIASVLMVGGGYGGTEITVAHTFRQSIFGGAGSTLVWLGLYLHLLPVGYDFGMSEPILIVGACMFFHFAISPHRPQTRIVYSGGGGPPNGLPVGRALFNAFAQTI
jgi:hypothetical protein